MLFQCGNACQRQQRQQRQDSDDEETGDSDLPEEREFENLEAEWRLPPTKLTCCFAAEISRSEGQNVQLGRGRERRRVMSK